MVHFSDFVLSYLPHDVRPEQVVQIVVLLTFMILYGVVWLVEVYFGQATASIAIACIAFVVGRWLYHHGNGVFGWDNPLVRSPRRDIAALASDAQDEQAVRLVCLSDTHGRHRSVDVPAGDVLIHCGDFTHRGTLAEIRDFNDWLGSLPHQHKIVIAGNHDLCMDGVEYDARWDTTWKHEAYNDPSVARSFLTNCTYVEERMVFVKGLRIYGSPMTPQIPGRIMAFNHPRDSAALEHWKKVPTKVDVLLTHGPPHGILDRTVTGLHVGDTALLREVVSRCRPQYHIFGHIHEHYGVARLGYTTFVNCASSTLVGTPAHPPIVLDVHPRVDKEG